MEEKERYELFGEHVIKDNDDNAKCQLLDTYKTYVILNQQYKENQQLKQQLAEKEKENLTLFSMLYETLEKQGYENITSVIEQMTNLTLEKQSNWIKENCVKNQDKISFSVEKLKRVKYYF